MIQPAQLLRAVARPEAGARGNEMERGETVDAAYAGVNTARIGRHGINDKI